MKKGKWSNSEIKLLKNGYSEVKNIEDLPIDRNVKSIYNKANVLNLKRPKNREYLDNLKKGKKFYFKKGHKPFNKGKKWDEFLSKESQKKITDKGFQKGYIPYTAKYEGKPYFVLRKSRNEKNWFIHKYGDKRRNYLRYLWKKEKGEIPKNHVIRFKGEFIQDRTPVISDLKCVSRRKLLNSNIGVFDVTDKYSKLQLKKQGIEDPSKSLIELKKEYLKLNREIKKYEENSESN